MTRKQAVVVAAVVLLASALSALIAYRLALRRLAPSATSFRADSPTKSGACIDFHDAASHVGENTCVSGRVVRVFTSRGGHVFLDFCPDYRSCPFTSVIFSSDRAKFGALETLQGRVVELYGTITVYNSRAEIVVRSPDQIRAAN